MKSSKLTKIVAILMSIMMLAGILVGCSGKDEPEVSVQNEVPNSAEGTENLEPVEITFATQSVGTSMYVYASALAQLIEKELPQGSIIDVQTTSPGGVGAPIIIDDGSADLTLGNAAPARWAAEDGILGNPPTTNVRSLAGGLGEDFVNILFTQEFVDKTGYTTVEEIVENKYPIRVAVKSSGAFGEMACAKVFEVLGVDYETIKSWGGTVTQTGSDAIVSLLKDGKADMTIDHVAAGQSATTELCMTTKMFFPELSEETRQKLNDMGWADVEIPAGTWKGQDKAIKSVGSPQVVLVSAYIDDSIAYAMTKAICEGKETLVSAHNALKSFDAATAWEPAKTGAELHPGAKKYYEEMGYIK